MKTCVTCPFWDVAGTTAPGGAAPPSAGECRRYPPTVTLAVTGHSSPGSYGEDRWPLTGPGQWCGEHPENRTPQPITGEVSIGDRLGFPVGRSR